MIQRLDTAIESNDRNAFEPIITFLEEHTIDHFKEEEQLMKNADFEHLNEHVVDHKRFTRKIKLIRKMYDENLHTTHVAYAIRQFIDMLITHILTIDSKMEGMKK